MDSVRLPFSDSADSASVRRTARRVLTGWQATVDVTDDALLIITELLQNVVQHADGDGHLTLTRHTNKVSIEVRDTCTDLPQPQRLDCNAPVAVAFVSSMPSLKPGAPDPTPMAPVKPFGPTSTFKKQHQFGQGR